MNFLKGVLNSHEILMVLGIKYCMYLKIVRCFLDLKNYFHHLSKFIHANMNEAMLSEAILILLSN